MRETVASPWKLILSRKGFDSSYGGMASPILPDGRLLALPIPAKHDRLRMADLNSDGVDLGILLHDLSGGQHSLETTIHCDPDLDRSPSGRLPGWRAALGQTGAAQSHLAAQGVGKGAVFLFFGWFREVELASAKWRYVPRAPDRHVLFGWLEVDEVLPIVIERQQCLAAHPWIANHPHVENPDHYNNIRNTLYVATSRFRESTVVSGAGRFSHFSLDLSLTSANESRSVWDLPAWFMPQGMRRTLSYNRDVSKWTRLGKRCLLKSAAKGQEFVLHAEDYPEARPWLKALLETHGAPRQH